MPRTMKIVALSAFLFALACLSILPAMQGDPRGPGRRGAPLDQVKDFLALSDLQVEDLKSLQSALREATRSQRQELGQRTKDLRMEARSDNPDSVRIDQLRAEIAALSAEMAEVHDQFRADAQSLLTPAQSETLTALAQALSLQSAAHQAVSLNLLEAPEGARRGFGGPRRGSRGGRGRMGGPPPSERPRANPIAAP